MSLASDQAIYHIIHWTCYICGTQSKTDYGFKYNPRNREEIDQEILEVHNKVAGEHLRIKPGCMTFGTQYFEIYVEQLPPGISRVYARGDS